MKNYAIKVLNGHLTGRVFPLKKKLLLGRNSGDIVLKAPSISEPHGEIKRHSNDRIILQDLDSKNGIFVNGNRKAKVLLERDMVFTIGETDFQLIVIKSPEEVWLEILDEKRKQLKDKPKKLKNFARPLEIHCISGPQKGEKFSLTYGPRFFGSGSVDIPILDKKVPDKAFKLVPYNEKILFQTEYPELCFKSHSKEKGNVLSNGETIVCGDTKLRVTFK